MEGINQEYDFLVKLLMLGDSTVGKSSLMTRIANDNFSEAFEATIGVDFRIRILNVGETRVKLQIWDTAGQERYRTITRAFYRNAQGIMIVYDITNKESFLNVDKWLQQAAEYGSPRARIILVGTKCDLESERQVSYEDGLRKAEQHGIKFIETSAKASTNVDTACKTLVSEILAEGDPITNKIDPLVDNRKIQLLNLKPGENELVKYATCC